MRFLPEHFELVFRRSWSWPVLVAALLVVALIVWQWNRPTRLALGKWASRLLTALKTLAAVLVVLWLVNPRIRYLSAKTEDAGIAVVLDSSMSMAAKDALNKTRYEAARESLMVGQEALGPELEKRFQVNYYLFNRGLKPIDRSSAPMQTDPAGLETNYGETLKALASEARSKRLKAVIFASDGNNTAGGDLRRAAQDVSAPIYAIAVGRRRDPNEPWRDLGIERIDAPTRVEVGRELKVKARLNQEGFAGESITVQAQQGETVLASTPYQLTEAPVQTVALTFTPQTKGTQTYVFSVPHLANDQIEENDQTRLSVAVTDRQMKVLYIEGQLRWVYKFVKRTLETEETIESDCVIRTGAAQFYHQGKSKLALRKGLPANYDDLGQYNVIILGDLPRAFADDGQLQLIDKWVRENKGGLLLIGGLYTLGSGEYGGSALETMMPATFKKQAPPRNPPPSKLELTPTGMGQNAMAGLAEVLPKVPLNLIFSTGGVKPGAETWIEVADGPSRGAPVLVTQRYGEGRTALLTTDELWEMSLREGGAAEKSPSSRFWLQLIQWLAQIEDKGNEEDPVVIASTDRSYYDSNQDVQISARLRKPADPGEALAVSGEILAQGQEIERLNFPEPDLSRAAKLTWKPPHDGLFTIRLHGQVGDNKGDLEMDTLVGRPFRERERNALDETTLRNLARDSGGAFFTLLNARDAGRTIEAAAAEMNERVEKDLLDSPWAFALFCGIVSVEWTLRRRKNLI
ncbi:MAG: hypothetical protein NTW86_24045 [Candidatus Sumerlaeota bacterium]|nr:hypothetical protein [Candidatus Sumerlaeota bacterium]